VDYENFAKEFSEEEKEKVRQKYNLPQKFLLYIGTFQPRKNIPVLIEAIKSLDIKLILAGNRNARNFDKKINEVIEKNNFQNKVIFPGWIDEEDKPALLQIADCFVFPSLYEGFGIPIVEAMAAGTPVISSNKTSLPEVGKDGALFCDPKNTDEFSKRIYQAIADENLKADIIKRGSEIAKLYSWQKTAEKTLNMYKSLM